MVKFSARHHKALAEILKNRIEELQKRHKTSETIGALKEISEIIDVLSSLFKEDNERFNPEKFKKAIYGE